MAAGADVNIKSRSLPRFMHRVCTPPPSNYLLPLYQGWMDCTALGCRKRPFGRSSAAHLISSRCEPARQVSRTSRCCCTSSCPCIMASLCLRQARLLPAALCCHQRQNGNDPSVAALQCTLCPPPRAYERFSGSCSVSIFRSCSSSACGSSSARGAQRVMSGCALDAAACGPDFSNVFSGTGTEVFPLIFQLKRAVWM